MKKVLAISLVLVIALSFVGCGNNKPVAPKQKGTSSTNEVESPASEESLKEESKEEESSKAEEAAEAAVSTVPTTGISEKWEDLEFAIDGKKFQIPFPYKNYEATGWSFNLADIGYADGYVLNPKDKTFSTIELKNSKYNKDFKMKIGFINNDTKAKDILECDVWAITFEANYGFKRLDNVPKVEIAKGVTWETSKADVEKAFGKPKDVYESKDHGYVVYTYDLDYAIKLKLDIYDDGGVSRIELNKY